MALAPDPADRALDAVADGAFGAKVDNRRAGYGSVEYEGREYTKRQWLLRAAKRGDCLAWGDAAKLVAYYEELVEAAYSEGWHNGFAHERDKVLPYVRPEAEDAWEASDARKALEGA